MINEIVRTPTRAEGGITDDEKARMAVISQKWIDVAMRTDPIEPNKIVPAVHALYEAAGLKKPRVVIVPSPLVMAFAYGASAWIWHCRKQDKALKSTYAATDAMPRDAATVRGHARCHGRCHGECHGRCHARCHGRCHVRCHARCHGRCTRAATGAAT